MPEKPKKFSLWTLNELHAIVLDSVDMEFKTEIFSTVSLYLIKERIYQSKIPDAFAQYVSYCVKVSIKSVILNIW